MKDTTATNYLEQGENTMPTRADAGGLSRTLAPTISLTGILIVAYAVSLSLPITIPWTILILGLIVMVADIAFRRGGLHPPADPVNTDKNTGEYKSSPLRLFFKAPLLKALVIFAGAIFLSGLVNGGLPEAWKSFCSLRGFLVYFWAYWAFTFNNNLKKFSVAALLIAGAIAGLWATAEQLIGFHPFSYPYLQGTGFLSAPMAFSGLTQIFSLLALGIALKNGYCNLPAKLSNPIVFFSILVCNWLGVIFAAERSAWLGVAVALLVTCLLFSRRAAILSGLFIATGSLVGYLALPVVRERLSSLMNWQTDVSVNTRVFLWQKAWETFQHSPIFGVGIRQFPHTYIPEALRQGHLALDHAHSNYLHILATTGIVGFCAYLYLWFTALKISYLSQKDPNPVPDPQTVGADVIRPFESMSLNEGIALGIFAGIVSLAVSGLFEYNFGTAQVRLAQWFVLAMLTQTKNIFIQPGRSQIK